MATVIFIDQENGGVASTILSKDRLKSTIPGKTLLKSHPGKVFGSSGTVVKPRKALGNVNKPVVNTAVPQKKGALGVKNSAPVTKQASEACIKPSKRNYPEIEKCVPYDPADFETSDVPEEHKLSHFYLGGAPLFVHEKEAANFDALTQEPAPMDVPVFSWESDISSTLPSFLATFDIALDLPQISEACIKPSKQGYPEIEKCLPYHPEEFETFDVPEECRLSHLYLAGVPLVYENGFALSTKEPIPMDIPVFSWESDISSTCPSFLATLDEVTLDMPKMENC
ncbi:securin-like [Rana temporaria]|uniref:securin-like n=1 Tax=Rana temporaria TaxID=8407 RepID=UPI001AAD3E86|nr:securin-like [Rana temporaria]